MARFYSQIQGNRGSATRMGTAASGIAGHICGWDLGIKVTGFVNIDGDDAFSVYLTSGSNGRGSGKYLDTYTIKDLMD